MRNIAYPLVALCIIAAIVQLGTAERPTSQRFRKAAVQQTKHAKSRSLFVVLEGTLALEQANPFGPWDRSLLFQSSHRQRPRLRDGVCRSGRHLRRDA